MNDKFTKNISHQNSISLNRPFQSNEPKEKMYSFNNNMTNTTNNSGINS
jgi:hypothetical protein